MKATGIVRRIDDLGRVVIPKEIRRTMRIREGDPLEIYTSSEGEVVFKKYSPVGEISLFACQYAQVLNKFGGLPALICDRDHVIAVSGVPKKDILERRVSTDLEEVMSKRRTISVSHSDDRIIHPVEGTDRAVLVSAPILAAGDVCGCVMFISADHENKATELQIKLIESAACFLGKQMEE